MELNYLGHEIGLTGTDSAKIFDKGKQKWIRFKANFSRVSKKKIFGKNVNVISKKDLIDYKQKIGRRVDINDVKELLS